MFGKYGGYIIKQPVIVVNRITLRTYRCVLVLPHSMRHNWVMQRWVVRSFLFISSVVFLLREISDQFNRHVLFSLFNLITQQFNNYRCNRKKIEWNKRNRAQNPLNQTPLTTMYYMHMRCFSCCWFGNSMLTRVFNVQSMRTKEQQQQQKKCLISGLWDKRTSAQTSGEPCNGWYGMVCKRSDNQLNPREITYIIIQIQLVRSFSPSHFSIIRASVFPFPQVFVPFSRFIHSWMRQR